MRDGRREDEVSRHPPEEERTTSTSVVRLRATDAHWTPTSPGLGRLRGRIEGSVCTANRLPDQSSPRLKGRGHYDRILGNF